MNSQPKPTFEAIQAANTILGRHVSFRDSRFDSEAVAHLLDSFAQQREGEARKELEAMAVELRRVGWCGGVDGAKRLADSHLRLLRELNERDRPAGFDSWEAYHAHIVKQGNELTALRSQLANHEHTIRNAGYIDECAADFERLLPPLHEGATGSWIPRLEKLVSQLAAANKAREEAEERLRPHEGEEREPLTQDVRDRLCAESIAFIEWCETVMHSKHRHPFARCAFEAGAKWASHKSLGNQGGGS